MPKAPLKPPPARVEMSDEPAADEDSYVEWHHGKKALMLLVAFASQCLLSTIAFACVVFECRKFGIHAGALYLPTVNSSGPKTSMTTGRHSASKP